MISRREFLQVAAATTALMPAGWTRAMAQQRMTQDELLRLPPPVGNVTLIHLADLHAQLKPVWFRESAVNIGVGDARGQLPHITGQAFLDRFHIERGSAQAYAFTAEDFSALARS